MGYNYTCPICKQYCFYKSSTTGYVMQGPIKQYFHLVCLESIARGNKHEEKSN